MSRQHSGQGASSFPRAVVATTAASRSRHHACVTSLAIAGLVALLAAGCGSSHRSTAPAFVPSSQKVTARNWAGVSRGMCTCEGPTKDVMFRIPTALGNEFLAYDYQQCRGVSASLTGQRLAFLRGKTLPLSGDPYPKGDPNYGAVCDQLVVYDLSTGTRQTVALFSNRPELAPTLPGTPVIRASSPWLTWWSGEALLYVNAGGSPGETWVFNIDAGTHRRARLLLADGIRIVGASSSPEGDPLALQVAGLRNGPCLVTESGKIVWEDTGQSLCYSPSGRHLAWVRSGAIILLDRTTREIRTYRPTSRLQGPVGQISNLWWIRDESNIVVAGGLLSPTADVDIGVWPIGGREVSPIGVRTEAGYSFTPL